MADRDFQSEISHLSKTLAGIESVLDIAKLQADVLDLESKAAAPDLWNNPENAQKVTSALSRSQSIISKLTSLRKRVDDLPVMLELANSSDNATSSDGMTSELAGELTSLQEAIGELEVRTLLSGEYDHRDALVTIRSEAGGVDAADWAEMVSRMFLRYCENKDFSVQVLETSYGEEAGIKSTTFKVSGPYAYGTLSVEQGTHRLVRISPFDSQNRRHTSFAGVEVVPVVEQSDHIEIDEKEIRVDVYRSSGPGGQGVNTTDSAVRITHIPPELLFLARMKDLKFKIKLQLWPYCNQNYWNEEIKKSGRKSTHLRATTLVLGEIKFVLMSFIHIKWLKIIALILRPEIPKPF